MQTSYHQYTSQSQSRPELQQSEYPNNQVALVSGSNKLQRFQVSPLLPQDVILTLSKKEQMLESYKNYVAKNKAALELDMDAFLKDIIRLFEELKEHLFLKMDDQVIAFNKIFEQYEKIALDCSDWAEQKIGSSNFQYDMKSSVTDLLHQGLHQARFQKQKADEIEKSLLAIKQKIDSSKLNELNEEIKMLSEERNQVIYVPEEARVFYDSLKSGLKTKISQLNQSKIVPPFAVGPLTQLQPEKVNFYEQNVKEPQNVIYQEKPAEPRTNLSGFLQQVFNKETEKTNVNPRSDLTLSNLQNPKIYIGNYSIRDGKDGGNQGDGQKCGIIAQQNLFYSDEMVLTNPTVKQEKELQFKIKSKINNVMSLISNIVLFGAEDGSIVIMNLSTNFQSIVKAHSTPVKGMTKANESLVISSANKPDTSLKLWDFGPILNGAENPDPLKAPGNVLLVGVLKGLNETAVGHGFIAENLILDVGEDGQILVWDWKTGVAIAQSKTEYQNINCFVMFSDRESFAISTTEGFVQSYSIGRDGKTFSFSKQSEFKESMNVAALHTFRGNNDIIITALSSGDVKLVSKKSKVNYHTIIGCKIPISFFVLNSVRSNSNIYLMSLETYGFKLADIDGRDFSYINSQSTTNFKFEKNGWPNWQIVDSISKEKITFVTINNGKEPNDAILWSLNAGK